MGQARLSSKVLWRLFHALVVLTKCGRIVRVPPRESWAILNDVVDVVLSLQL